MTQIPCLVPRNETKDLTELLKEVKAAPALKPFSEPIISFLSTLSKSLLRDPRTKAYVELQVLSFWLRKAEVTKMASEFQAMATPSTLLVPRGVAFHIPPSNVDTISAYSLAIALAVGNKNIVRISKTRSEQANIILDAINATLESLNNEMLNKHITFVEYGYESEITHEISQQADLRIIWGGDQTVRKIRAIEAKPRCLDVSFANRTGLAALSASRWLESPTDEQYEIAKKFYNDAYMFGQMACSSPLCVVWVGSEADSQAAKESFANTLTTYLLERPHMTPPAVAMTKMVESFDSMMSGGVKACHAPNGHVTLMDVGPIRDWTREKVGGGLFYTCDARELTEIASFVFDEDQTLATFGFSQDELRELAISLNGKGIERFVPVGQALAFSRFWDGFDLLQQFSKTIHLMKV